MPQFILIVAKSNEKNLICFAMSFFVTTFANDINNKLAEYVLQINRKIMKKYMFVCAGLCLAMALTSCGSKDSAYRKAYEKAKAQEAVINETTPTENVIVAPVETKPYTETPQVDNYDNVSVRSESLSVIDGAGLKNFSVVVGSFSVKANAEGLCQQLRNAGYGAQIAYNSARNMYRVIASTSDDKATAVRSRNEFRSKYPDAWLLFNQR